MNLNDGMKYYEKTFIHQQAINRLPIIARIDGRNFSSFTKNTIKPFDYTFLKCMEETTKHLVKETGANIDLALIDGKLKVLEFNCINSSGFYKNDVDKIFKTLKEYYESA